MKRVWRRIVEKLGILVVLMLLSGYVYAAASGEGQNGYPDFTLSAAPDTIEVCNGGGVAYTVSVGQIEGFLDPVTLYTEDTPPGTAVSFSTNPIQPNTPPATSTLTIGNITGDIAGNYTVKIGGIAPTSTHTTTVQLNVFDTLNGSPALTLPVNDAAEVSLTPTFSWNSLAGAASYEIEIAADADFTNIFDAASKVPTTQYTPSIHLAPATTYYWHVRGNNPCGNGSYSPMRHFTTVGTRIFLPLITN